MLSVRNQPKNVLGTKSYNYGSNFMNFFELLLHKINFFREKTGSIWTVPSDFLGKKMQLLFYECLGSSG